MYVCMYVCIASKQAAKHTIRLGPRTKLCYNPIVVHVPKPFSQSFSPSSSAALLSSGGIGEMKDSQVFASAMW